MNTVRHGVTQAHFNRGPATFVALEIIITAVVIGSLYRSWVIGFAVTTVLFMFLVFNRSRIILIVGYSIFWSVAAVAIGHELAGIPGAVIIGVFGSLVAFGVHLAGATGLIESAP